MSRFRQSQGKKGLVQEEGAHGGSLVPGLSHCSWWSVKPTDGGPGTGGKEVSGVCSVCRDLQKRGPQSCRIESGLEMTQSVASEHG